MFPATPQDTTVLIQRMKDQLVVLRNAYTRELKDIYGAMKQDLDETRDRHQDDWRDKLDEIVAVSYIRKYHAGVDVSTGLDKTHFLLWGRKCCIFLASNND